MSRSVEVIVVKVESSKFSSDAFTNRKQPSTHRGEDTGRQTHFSAGYSVSDGWKWIRMGARLEWGAIDGFPKLTVPEV